MLSFAPFEDVCRLEAKSCHIVIVYVPPEEIETRYKDGLPSWD